MSLSASGEPLLADESDQLKGALSFGNRLRIIYPRAGVDRIAGAHRSVETLG